MALERLCRSKQQKAANADTRVLAARLQAWAPPLSIVCGQRQAWLAAAEPARLLVPLQALARQHRTLEEEVDALKAVIVARVREEADMKRLARIPMIGPMTAHAMVAAVGDGRQFNSARDFAAWLGLTPKQASSGERLASGKISKQGDEPLRRLFVLGAANALRRPDRASPWMKRLLARRPPKVAMIAQAAKTARIAWAVLVSNEEYRTNIAPAASVPPRA